MTSKYKTLETKRQILKFISFYGSDLRQISQVCLTNKMQLKKYPDHANMFTRKSSENNQNVQKKKGQF